MRLTLADFLKAICRDAVIGARAGTMEAVRFAKVAQAMDIEVPIGGVPMKVEGASNLPPRIMQAKRARFKTSAYLEAGDGNEPMITLKRGLLRSAPEIEIEIDFERSMPMEAMEMVRDRANEINKQHVQKHREEFADNATARSLEDQTKEEMNDGPTN